MSHKESQSLSNTKNLSLRLRRYACRKAKLHPGSREARAGPAPHNSPERNVTVKLAPALSPQN